mgnify:CR=1 FL=1
MSCAFASSPAAAVVVSAHHGSPHSLFSLFLFPPSAHSLPHRNHHSPAPSSRPSPSGENVVIDATKAEPHSDGCAVSFETLLRLCPPGTFDYPWLPPTYSSLFPEGRPAAAAAAAAAAVVVPPTVEEAPVVRLPPPYRPRGPKLEPIYIPMASLLQNPIGSAPPSSPAVAVVMPAHDGSPPSLAVSSS